MWSVLTRKTPGESDKPEVTLYFVEGVESETLLLRKLALLPFAPIWCYYTVIVGFLNCQGAMLSGIYTLCCYKDHWFPSIFYFADVIWFLNITLLAFCKSTLKNIIRNEVIFSDRHFLWFIIDYISIVPIELFVPDAFRPYCGLNKMLKVFYIVWVCNVQKSMLGSPMKLHVFDLLFKLFYVITMVAIIFTMIVVHVQGNPKGYNVGDILYIVTDHMTLKGFGQIAEQHYWTKLLAMAFSLVLFVGVLILCTANLTFYFLTRISSKTTFSYKYNCIKSQFTNYSQEFHEVLDTYFDAMWSFARGQEEAMGGKRLDSQVNRRIIHDTELKLNILSPSFLSDIALDMCTAMFRHSLILRNYHLGFLRDLASFVTFEVYLENQFLMKLDEVKDKLMYIYKGTVDIISEEDGETALVQLTAGTVLSEINLILPVRSSYMVRCSTTCVVHILKQVDFKALLTKHRLVRHDTYNTVFTRIQEAKELKKLQTTFNIRQGDITEQKHVGWVLHKLHYLISVAYPDIASLHVLPNTIQAYKMECDIFRNKIFSPNFLTLYTVPEIRQEYKDTLFTKSTFPFVIRNDTGLTRAWEIFIGIMSIIAGILIPYYASTSENDKTTIIEITYLFTGIWAIDLVVQLRTSSHNKDHLSFNIFDSFIFKLTSTTFILDIFSILPVEMFSAILVKERNRNYVYINRILKLARIKKIIDRWDAKYNTNPLVIRLVSSLLLILYSIFLVSCYFFYTGYRGESGIGEFQKLLFYTNQMFSVAIWVEGYSEGFPPYQKSNIILYILICVIYAIMYATIFSARASNLLHVLQLKHRTQKLVTAATHMDTRYSEYIRQVLTDHFAVHKGLHLHWPDYIFKCVPVEVVGYIYTLHFEVILQEFKIFNQIPAILRKKIFVEGGCIRCYAPNEVLFHTGDILTEIFLLVEGCVEIRCGVKKSATIVAKLTDLNSVEVSLIIPMRSTVITNTHCLIVRIKYPVLRRVVLEMSSRKTIRSQLGGYRALRAKILHTRLVYQHLDILEYRKQDTYRNRFTLRTDAAYFAEFRKHGMFYVSRLLLPLAIDPHGKFLYYWEIGRCVCAIASAVLFTSIIFYTYTLPHPVALLKWGLEFMAFLDLYLRMHVAYYTETKVLIKHPALTSIHYFHHSFLVDFLGAIPLHVVITNATQVLWNINKLLQLHRFISFMNYKLEYTVTPPNKLYMLSHIPITLIYMNMMSSVVLLLNCTIDAEDKYDVIINCPSTSLFSDETYTIKSVLEAHVHAIYMILSICSKTGVQGFKVVGNQNMLLVSAMTVIGLAIEVLQAARIYGYFITTFLDSMHVYTRMRLLSAFLGGKTGSQRAMSVLVREAEIHVNRMWIMRSTNIYYQTRGYPSQLRRDLLFKKYGVILQESLLPNARDVQPFIRNLLVNSKYRIQEAHTALQRENDICEYTEIVYSGLVYIHSKDFVGTEIVSLGPGSIIGNLCPLQYNRLQHTVISIGLVEIIYIKTNKFFELLQHFPSSHEVFTALRGIHVSHVPGQTKFVYSTEIRQQRRCTITKQTGFLWILLNLLIGFGILVSQLFYFYDIIAVNVYSTYYYWITDLLYICAIILVFFLPLTTETGHFMTSAEVITEFFRVWMFVICVFSAIPFYLLVPLNLDGLLPYYFITLARSNVLLRSFFIYKIMAKTTMRWLSLIYSLTFMGHIIMTICTVGGMSAVLILISELDATNMKPNINLRQLLRMPVDEKLDHVITNLYIVTNMFTHTSQSVYYPCGPLYTFVFIIIMCLVMVYNAVIYSTMVSMVQAFQQLKLRYQMAKDYILAIMDRSDTSPILKTRLDYYCKMAWMIMKGLKVPSLFLKLPRHLREELCKDLFGGILEYHMCFSKLHYDIKRQMYGKLQVEYFFHGDFIAYSGAVTETMYFVHAGKVVMLDKDNFKVLAHFRAGQYFCILEGISDKFGNKHSYRADRDSIILYLARSDWYHMLKFFPASENIMAQVALELFEKPHFD